jgi:hypothetical protein
LGIRDLFRKRPQDEVVGTRILIGSLDPKFAELIKNDCHCYSQFYATPTETVFESSQELFKAIRQGYDIVHLFCDLSSDGNIMDGRGNVTTAIGLLQCCSESGAKLVWLASENKPQGYIQGFKTAGKPLNLVFTIDRRGSRFSNFLENLLRKMAAGETMPVAWASVSPQNSNDPRNQDAPACIFAAGRGGVRLR